MKAASTALQTFLAGISQGTIPGLLFIADLFKFSLLNGSHIYLCSGDGSLIYSSVLYLAGTRPGDNSPIIKRSKVKCSTGLNVDQMELNLYASPVVQLNGVPILQAIQQGQFDGGKVVIRRAFMSGFYGNMALPTGAGDNTCILFAGDLADIGDLGRSSVKITVKAPTEKLDIQMPRNLFQPGCRHTLFDTGCTLNAAAFQVTGAIQAGSNFAVLQTNLTQTGTTAAPVAGPVLTQGSGGINLNPTTYFTVVTYVGALGESLPSPATFLAVTQNNVLHAASPPSHAGVTGWNVYVSSGAGDWQKQNFTPIAIGTPWIEGGNGLTQGTPPPVIAASGWFAKGTITFTSGANNGLQRFVSEYDSGGVVTVMPPLPQAPAIGDTFTILPGCDKTMGNCRDKFGNVDGSGNLVNFGAMPFIPNPEAGL